MNALNKLCGLTLLALAMQLSACGGGSGSSGGNDGGGSSGSSTPSPTPAPKPAIKEDLSPGLKGVDANNNGIRDDVDQLIANEFSQTPAIKKAAEQRARATQKIMEANTKEEAFEAARVSSLAIACIYFTVTGDTHEDMMLRRNIGLKIESLTTNTKERLEKYLAANKMLSGGTFSLAKQDSGSCD